MVQNNTIIQLIEKAVANGYRLTFITDTINLSEWQSMWLPGGTIQLWKGNNRIYLSVFDSEFAQFIWGDTWSDVLKDVINRPLRQSIEQYLTTYGSDNKSTT